MEGLQSVKLSYQVNIAKCSVRAESILEAGSQLAALEISTSFLN
jgi:hypothetical protein